MIWNQVGGGVFWDVSHIVVQNRGAWAQKEVKYSEVSNTSDG